MQQTHMPAWPDWIESARLDDATAARSYEATPPACRTALKTALALTFTRFGEYPGRLGERRDDTRRGFWHRRIVTPAEWAVIAFPASYAAAARLAAACVLPRLCGVRLLAAVCADGEPSSPALTSLELCGVEDIFCLDSNRINALLEELAADPGRVVLLHKGELDACGKTARRLRLPCYEENRPPVLNLIEPDVFDPDILAFAQGDALSQADNTAGARPRAVYTASAEGREGLPESDALVLTPGCEAFWLHEGLTPDFFTVQQEAFGLLQKN